MWHDGGGLLLRIQSAGLWRPSPCSSLLSSIDFFISQGNCPRNRPSVIDGPLYREIYSERLVMSQSCDPGVMFYNDVFDQIITLDELITLVITFLPRVVYQWLITRKASLKTSIGISHSVGGHCLAMVADESRNFKGVTTYSTKLVFSVHLKKDITRLLCVNLGWIADCLLPRSSIFCWSYVQARFLYRRSSSVPETWRGMSLLSVG